MSSYSANRSMGMGGVGVRSGGRFGRRPLALASRAGQAHALESLEQRQLFVADPVTMAHAMWFANYGAVAVDGVINDAEWADSVPIVRAQANRPESTVTLRMKYTELGLYVAADVRDQYLWADGAGAGTGTRYDWFDDDSLALFFDASNTRKRMMTEAGRAIAFNLGSVNGPTSGSGAVTRYNYIRGNWDPFGVAVNPYGMLTPGMTWTTTINGTVNNNADVDTGWVTEVFLPWSTINFPSMPRNGQAMTMNFSVLFDETGGNHDHSAKDQDPNAQVRFGPRAVDDQIDGTPSSFSASTPGMEGPISYAWVIFTDGRTVDAPKQVNALSVANVTGYSARLNFTAPAASQAAMALGIAKRGGVYQYDIRWSDTPITDDASWEAATVIENSFVPQARGVRESLRLGGFEPGTTYYVAIRTLDTAGRISPIQQVTFTTQTTVQDTSGGDRLMTSPGGGSLITEGGSPWLLVGSSVIPTNLYARNMYPGDVWDAANDQYLNFVSNPGPEGSASGFFDSLAMYNVNTLRVTMEWLALETAGQGDLPRGMHWLEYPAGNYNPDMKTYLLAMMDQAHRTGIKLILKPFDTFNYKAFFDLSAYSTANGGPLTSINDFFQSATVIDMAAGRVNTLIDWANDSAYPETIAGIELPNEWDDWTWTLNARGDGDPSRLLEMRDRSKFMMRTAAKVRLHDPNTNIVSSSIGLVPRGPTARAMFLGEGFDILAPHWYSTTTAEPVNSPDADKSIRPATDWAGLANYWTSNKRDNRVINNGEWGLVKWLWQGGKTYYTGISPNPVASKPWTLQNDVDMYRTTSWTQIATGLGGSGFRLGGQEMRDLVPSDVSPGTTGYLPIPLPTGMREIQHSVRTFTNDNTIGFDYAQFDAHPLAGRMKVTGTAKKVVTSGSTDGEQGMVYILQDLNQTTGNIAGATLAIDGLANGLWVNVEFWSTGSNAQQLSVVWGIEVTGGKLTIPLPTFNKDVMVRFRADVF